MFCFWTVLYPLEMSIEKMAQPHDKLANTIYLLSKSPKQRHFLHSSEQLSTLFYTLSPLSCYTHHKSIKRVSQKKHEMLQVFTK